MREYNTADVPCIVGLADSNPPVQLGRVVKSWQLENLSLLVSLVDPTPPLLLNLVKNAFLLSKVQIT